MDDSRKCAYISTMRLPLMIAAALLVIPAAAGAALRCGNLLAQEGDTQAAVQQKCGEPAYRNSYCADAAAGSDREPALIVPCDMLEEWTYRPASGQLTPTLLFRRGKLEEIRYGERAP